MHSWERVRRVIAGEPVDHLPAQPLIMMFAAKNAGMKYIDYTRDGLKMAAAQLQLIEDYGLDCLLTCSDPVREVIDIAGEGSVLWFVGSGCEVSPATPPENLRDMLAYAREHKPEEFPGES